MKIKFAHVSDCHLGAWRKESLNQVGYQAFSKMIDQIIEENVDFVIISGDLYDVSNPKVVVVDLATKQLKRLIDNGISIYGIMGSHDFSPSGRSMILPLISGGFFKNVSEPSWKGKEGEKSLMLKFFEDPKSKIKITGMRARRRGLEVEDYQKLDLDALEREEGPKVFVLHTLLSEMKPKEFKDMKTAPKSLLPRNFCYYAGGHIHKTLPESLRKTQEPFIIKNDDKLKQKVVYPGSIYPTNFKELEEYKHGGFCLINGDLSEESNKVELRVTYKPLKIKDVITIQIDGNNKPASTVKNLIDSEIENNSFEDKIVTIRILGELSEGKTVEIKSSEIIRKCKEKGAYEVLVNKAGLSSKEYKPIHIEVNQTSEEIESELVHKHAQKSDVKNISKEKMEDLIHRLLKDLGRERKDDEKVKDYEKDIVESFYTIMEIPYEEDEL
jgi:hypothetical protein